MLISSRLAPLANMCVTRPSRSSRCSLGWQLLPPALTQLLLGALYGAQPGLRPVVLPQSSLPDRIAANERAQTHARRAQASVVAAYLAWSLGSSVHAVRSVPTFYGLLHLDAQALPQAEFEGFLRSAWRRLVRVAHPDVVGPAGEERFRAMRTAYETLGDPIQRDAYERCGGISCARLRPQLRRQRAAVRRQVHEHVRLSEARPRRLAHVLRGPARRPCSRQLDRSRRIGVLCAFDKFRLLTFQWRYVCLAAIFAAEVRVVLAPTHESPLSWIPVVGTLLPWQHVVMLHDLFIALSCACGQIVPLLRPEPVKRPPSAVDELAPIQPMLDDLVAGARDIDARMIMATRSDVQASFGAGEARPAHVEATIDRVRAGALSVMIDARTKADEEGAKAWAAATGAAPI